MASGKILVFILTKLDHFARQTHRWTDKIHGTTEKATCRIQKQ